MGLATFFVAGWPMRVVCGTPSYLAPEVLAVEAGELDGYTAAVDLYGAGLLLFIALFGVNPLKRESTAKTGAAILAGDWRFPATPTVSAAARQLLVLLLSKEVDVRPTAREALLHPWVSPGPASS